MLEDDKKKIDGYRKRAKNMQKLLDEVYKEGKSENGSSS